jgi:hypothetical protein
VANYSSARRSSGSGLRELLGRGWSPTPLLLFRHCFLRCRATSRGNAIPVPNSAAPGVEMELLGVFLVGGSMFGADI